MSDLTHWSGVPRPERRILEGRHARLEPLELRHEAELVRVAGEEPERFRWLADRPGDVASWIAKASTTADPLFFAVVDRATARVEGRQALMRIDVQNGVIEIGSILWGPAIARTPVATEALYLFASYVFDTLGYRRFEWKCNDRNEPSKRAAVRFGFTHEGVFRQHMVTKGENRDTAWFAMIDTDWPRIKAAFDGWLDPSNFGPDGIQRQRLAASAG